MSSGRRSQYELGKSAIAHQPYVCMCMCLEERLLVLLVKMQATHQRACNLCFISLQIFSLILESRREVHWTYGPVTSSIYKLEELDSFEDRNSVLDVIVRSEADNVS